MTETTPDVEQLINDYVDVWNEQEYSKIPDIVSESFVMDDPAASEDISGSGGEVHGPDGLGMLIRGVVAGFPALPVTILDTRPR
jgi:hypothetical protein